MHEDTHTESKKDQGQEMMKFSEDQQESSNVVSGDNEASMRNPNDQR